MNNTEERVDTGDVAPTCLRVPQFEIAVIGSAEELSPGVVEANISHCFAVA